MKFLSLVTEQISDSVIVTNLQYEIIYTNHAFQTIYGYSEEELLGQSPGLVNAESAAEKIQDAIYKTLSAGKTWRGELWNRRKDGSRFFCDLTVFPLSDENGMTFAYAGIQRDITKRKEEEEILRRYEAIISNSTDMMALIGEDLTYVSANAAYLHALGKTREDLIGRTVSEVLGEELTESVIRPNAERCLAGEEIHYEEWFDFPVSGRVFMDVAYFPYINADKKIKGFVVSARNVTDRKQFEDALQRSERETKIKNRILEIFLTLPDEDAYAALVELVLKETGSELGTFGYFAPDGSFVVLAITREAYWDKCQVSDKNLIFRKSDFSGIWRQALREKKCVVSNVGPFSTPPGHVPIRNTIVVPVMYREEVISSIHLANKASDYTEEDQLTLEMIANQVAPVLNARLERDRHEEEKRKSESEQRKLERQVQQAQKLESLGVLAGGIAHDFNNLLMTILGNADLAQRVLSAVSPARPFIKEIEKASRRATDLTRQMLAYSGKGQFVIQAINLSELVKEMAHLLHASESKNVTVRTNLSRELPLIEADSAQIQQVVMNLITNASEAIEADESGVMAVSTGEAACSQEYLSASYLDEKQSEGKYVFIEVMDTGCGMDSETKAKIFDPFFSSKFTGRGLGLAAALGIVRGHKGAIMVDSELGKGTTIRVLFPALTKRAAIDPAGRSAAMPGQLRGTGSVLVVDDEEAVRTISAQMLERLGFTVLTASDGREALATFTEHADEINCVVLDLTMPKMGGKECLQKLQQIKSEVPVIISSGYSEQEVSKLFSGKRIAGFIQKPYSSDALIAKLKEVLEC